MPPLARILIVEDEPAIAETVAYALRAEGFEVEHVLIGAAVIPRVKAGGVDLVILDIGLPDGSGLDVCRALRALSDVPVIFLSARRARSTVYSDSNSVPTTTW